MPLDRDRATLLDLRLASQRIIEFVGDQDYAAFSQDVKTQEDVPKLIAFLDGVLPS